jgi:hypothetical protein
MEYWAQNHSSKESSFKVEDAKMMLKAHFAAICSPEAMKSINKIFGL